MCCTQQLEQKDHNFVNWLQMQFPMAKHYGQISFHWETRVPPDTDIHFPTPSWSGRSSETIWAYATPWLLAAQVAWPGLGPLSWDSRSPSPVITVSRSSFPIFDPPDPSPMCSYSVTRAKQSSGPARELQLQPKHYTPHTPLTQIKVVHPIRKKLCNDARCKCYHRTWPSSPVPW